MIMGFMATSCGYSFALLPPSSISGSDHLHRLRTLSFCSKTPAIFRISSSRLRVLSMRQSQAPVVSGNSWNSLILKSEIPVLVEFYASWCGPCQMVHRVIDEITADYAGKLNCFVLDAGSDPQIAEDYDIKAVPVVLLFKNGKKCESVVGTMPKEFYVAAIERILAP